MKITLNGKPYDIDSGETAASLLARLALDVKQVAIERNREIVPRSQHGQTPIAEGDVVEIVRFIGGG